MIDIVSLCVPLNKNRGTRKNSPILTFWVNMSRRTDINVLGIKKSVARSRGKDIVTFSSGDKIVELTCVLDFSLAEAAIVLRASSADDEAFIRTILTISLSNI